MKIFKRKSICKKNFILYFEHQNFIKAVDESIIFFIQTNKEYNEKGI